MSRFRRAALPAALLLALAAVPAAAHEGNPDYRSTVREITPPTEGLTARVLDHDDALLVVNQSDEVVVILGDRGVPYARLLADGTVQVNTRSPLAHEDEEPEADGGDEGASAAPLGAPSGPGLYASVTLLAHGDEVHEASPAHSDDATGDDATRGARANGPAWLTLDGTGRFQWHDDRIKYRASAVPPQVTDESEETKVKDWRVPIAVGGQPGAIAGTLTWVGEPGGGSSFPTAAVVSLVVLAGLAVGAVAVVRRRRAAGEQGR